MTNAPSVDPSQRRRMGVVGVHSVDHFAFSVDDLDEAESFYRTFGLDVRRLGDRLELHTYGHPHRWGAVFQEPGGKRLQYVSYGIDTTDLPTWSDRIARHGLASEPHPLSDGSGLWLRNPDGTPVQLKTTAKVSPSIKSPPSPTQPASHVRGAPSRSQAPVVRPRWLSHLLFFTPDVARMVAFSAEVLGLRLSDHSGDIIAFMHGAHGSDHHLVAYAKSHAPGLHHSSWDVGSIDEIGCGAEQMRSAGYGQGWGLGRHVLGSNYFHYVQDPWGSYAEYSFDIDFVPHDVEWPAADHPPQDSLYVWGPAVPEAFVTNHEVPISRL